MLIVFILGSIDDVSVIVIVIVVELDNAPLCSLCKLFVGADGFPWWPLSQVLSDYLLCV